MRSDDICFHVIQLLAQVAATRNQYYQLVLLLGGNWENRTRVLKALAESQNMLYVSLGYSLSRALLDISSSDRPLNTETSVMTQIPTGRLNGLVLDHLEILFDPDLSTDPFRLLQNISREYPVVASWPGCYDGRRLTYAIPSHREYYTEAVQGLLRHQID